MSRISRRDFVRAGASAGMAAAAPAHGAQSAAVRRSAAVRPVVIASSNGHRYRNGGPQTCVERAFSLLMEGRDVLEAIIAGVTIVELDPEDTSVGFGGLPNAEGVVQLDASCMHGPRKRAGAVAALEGVRTPALVAQKVMDHTDHHLLVGRDAQRFARNMGFTIEDDLNTARSRGEWLEWKRRTDPLHYLDPGTRDAAGRQVVRELVADGRLDPHHLYGTINCNGINGRGEICGVTTTSGLAWKIPGRVGDSPILGAGLYVDGQVGAAGSTGRGEANLFSLASFLIVEEMRRGRAPKDAGVEALRRIQANTIERRLLNARGEPNFNISFYVLNARGEYAGVCMYNPGSLQFAVCDETGARLERLEPLLAGDPSHRPSGSVIVRQRTNPGSRHRLRRRLRTATARQQAGQHADGGLWTRGPRAPAAQRG